MEEQSCRTLKDMRVWNVLPVQSQELFELCSCDINFCYFVCVCVCVCVEGRGDVGFACQLT